MTDNTDYRRRCCDTWSNGNHRENCHLANRIPDVGNHIPDVGKMVADDNTDEKDPWKIPDEMIVQMNAEEDFVRDFDRDSLEGDHRNQIGLALAMGFEAGATFSKSAQAESAERIAELEKALNDYDDNLVELSLDISWKRRTKKAITMLTNEAAFDCITSIRAALKPKG